MNRFEDINAWRAYRQDLDAESLGFVPTMGALHPGHRALIEASVAENDCTVVSIFINPTQFDRAADLAGYPKTLDSDLRLLKQCGVDAVLVPDADSLYPDEYRYRVVESDLSTRYCGAHRPGHFDGVLTVVMRLLNIVRPERAYFGEKDYQQLELVRGMVEAFFMDVEIIACPTVRESDGLAMSSRNQRLTSRQRALAPKLYRSLSNCATPRRATESLERAGFDVDYVADISGRRLAAASLGEVRLIDNVSLESADGR